MTILAHTSKNASQALLEEILGRTGHWDREQFYDTLNLGEAHIALIRYGFNVSVEVHDRLLSFKDLLDKLQEEVVYTNENNFPAFNYHDKTYAKGV